MFTAILFYIRLVFIGVDSMSTLLLKFVGWNAGSTRSDTANTTLVCSHEAPAHDLKVAVVLGI